MNKIIMYTQAYNAAGTLQRTIDSVKSQTHTDWLWFVIDNCSSDATGSIIMREAISDPRIIPFRMARNNITAYIRFWLILKKNFPDCCFMDLDADDTIQPECLETLLDFMKEHSLDIAACGTEFASVGPEGHTVISKVRSLESDLILEGSDFADFFRLYRPFTNEMWGKLYKFSVITEEALAVYSKHHYDSQLVLQLFERAKRTGIVAKPLHRAYLGEATLSAGIKGIASRNADANPIEAQVSHWLDGTDYIRHVSYQSDWRQINTAFKRYRSFLERCGPLSVENREYLYAIYIEWIHENLIQLYLAFAPQGNHGIYSIILEMLQSDVFQEVFTYIPHSDQYRNLAQRRNILSQMYHFVSISEYSVNNPEFLRRTKEEIAEIREGLPL